MTEHNIATVNVHELKTRLDNDSAICLIDVREQDEWDAGHIPGAIHIPKNRLTSMIEAQQPDRNKPVFLHCKGGTRSATTAGWLMDMGYQQVYSVAGGISDWEANGYPVTTA